MATNLRAYDFTGKRIASVSTTVWSAWSSLADILADKFGTYAGLIHADEGDDGVEYINIDGKRVAYVVSVTDDGREIGERPEAPQLQAAE